MTTCLQAGGKQIEEAHLRLMINCQEICQTTANFMLSESAFHGAVCNACAQVCNVLFRLPLAGRREVKIFGGFDINQSINFYYQIRSMS